MITKIFLLAAFCLPLIETIAQSKDERTTVEAQVESLSKAMVDADKTTLERITAPQLSYGHSSGKIDTRESFIKTLVTGESDFTDIKLVDQTIEVIDNVALVRHKLTGQTHDKGKDPANVNIGVLLVWYKFKNEWKLVARQAFKL